MAGEDELFIAMGKVLGYLSLGVYSVLLAIFWGPLLLLRNIVRSFREFGVDSWPRANGLITSQKVNAIHGWVVDYALGQLEYTYKVHGDYYSGSVTRQFPDEQVAWDFVDAHRDEPVMVRYRDDKPELSILIAADQSPGWTLNVGPGILVQVWHHIRNELQPRSGAQPRN